MLGGIFSSIGIDLDMAWRQQPAVVVVCYLGLVIAVAMIANALSPAERHAPDEEFGGSVTDSQGRNNQHGEEI